MSHLLIGRNPDLKRLRDEGYEVAITSDGYLTVHGVPYLDSNGVVQRGILLCPVEPPDHTVMFCGDYPHEFSGKEIEAIRHQTMDSVIDGSLHVRHKFSNKPHAEGKYRDRYHMMTRYIEIMENQAKAVEPNVTARTFKPIADSDSAAVFKYIDTASSRANIIHLADKFDSMKVAIVGLGGTGSYVLDFVAKTRVKEIHLFDGDDFAQHNAYRAPGAPSFEDMDKNPLPKKVAYLTGIYSRMRNNIVTHEEMIDESNVELLSGMDFVFVCIDGGSAKRIIVEALVNKGVPFIDTGIGVNEGGGMLLGAIRVTASSSDMNTHLQSRISTQDAHIGDAYSSNIQTAELNALAASLAVVKWKKMAGFYSDREQEHNSLYMIEANKLINEDNA
jgi:hypothetical protein